VHFEGYYHDETFACRIPPDEIHVVWQGPHPDGRNLQAAFYAVCRKGVRWSKPSMIADPEGKRSDVAAPEIIPVTIDRQKVPCVFWKHNTGAIRFVFGGQSGWSDVKEVRAPWRGFRLSRAVEVSPGTIGMLCKIAGNPSYFEVSVVGKGERVKTAGVPRHDSQEVPTATPGATPGKKAGKNALAGPAAVEPTEDLGDARPGSVWAWGFSAHEQSVTGTVVVRRVPFRERGLEGVKAIAAGRGHYLALKSDGTVWGWGDNRQGQLGDGTTEFREGIVQAKGLAGVVDVAAGESHSLALKADGTVWAWGGNADGQLGDDRPKLQPRPTKVQRLSGAIAISSGANHCLALKADGTVWSWGRNYSGQVGRGIPSVDTHWWPIRIRRLMGVKAVAAGGDHSLALREDGTVWAWGSNSQGQLGDGRGGSRYDDKKSTPGRIPDLVDVIGIACGGTHSLAVKRDGTVWAWGGNGQGQLGHGTTETRKVPVLVRGLSEVKAVAAAMSYSLALKKDGTVWAWGEGRLGQLGDGTTESRSVPVQAKGLPRIKAIAAAGARPLALGD